MKTLSIILIFLLPVVVSAQLFDGEEYEYNSEIIWGINKNTNGGLIGGLMVRYSRSKGDLYETFGFEMSNVKHPSESRYVGAQGQTFIYGKTNYLYALRLQYGREKLLFKKATQQGVQISAGASVGPTFGLVNPYYILETTGDYDQFDPLRHPSPESIAGPGKLFQGLGETNLVPGLNFKTSASFEFGTYRSNVAGVEIGLMLETYTKEIVLVPTQSNRSTFTSIFMTLFWGTRK
jgi:hypothetical protein